MNHNLKFIWVTVTAERVVLTNQNTLECMRAIKCRTWMNNSLGFLLVTVTIERVVFKNQNKPEIKG